MANFTLEMWSDTYLLVDAPSRQHCLYGFKHVQKFVLVCVLKGLKFVGYVHVIAMESYYVLNSVVCIAGCNSVFNAKYFHR